MSAYVHSIESSVNYCIIYDPLVAVLSVMLTGVVYDGVITIVLVDVRHEYTVN